MSGIRNGAKSREQHIGIRILTINAFQLSKIVVRGLKVIGSPHSIDARNQLERADRLVEEIKANDYDIVVAQEMFGEGKARITNALKKWDIPIMGCGSKVIIVVL